MHSIKEPVVHVISARHFGIIYDFVYLARSTTCQKQKLLKYANEANQIVLGTNLFDGLGYVLRRVGVSN